MAIQPAFRAQQTTSTTGTGTLTLIAAAANVRSLQSALGSSSIVTEYVLSGTTFYEYGIGTYDGGSPGTLTRTTIIASSNSNAAVSLPAGTADVFIPFTPGMHGRLTGTGSDTLTVAQFGQTYVWSGTGAGTVTLPAVASCPPDRQWEILNAGTAILTIDGNSTETINGFTSITLYPGQVVRLRRRAVAAGISTTAWIAPGYTSSPPLWISGTGSVTSGTGSVTFSVAFPNAIIAASIQLTPKGASGTATLYAPVVGNSPTVSGFNVYADSAQTFDFNYICAGY